MPGRGNGGFAIDLDAIPPPSIDVIDRETWCNTDRSIEYRPMDEVKSGRDGDPIAAADQRLEEIGDKSTTLSFDRNFVPEQHQAIVQERIAYALLALIALLALSVTISLILGHIDIEEVKELSLAFCAPLFSIFATVVGFYFGSNLKR